MKNSKILYIMGIALTVVAVVVIAAWVYTHDNSRRASDDGYIFDVNNYSTYPEGYGAMYYSLENDSARLPTTNYVDGNFSGRLAFFNGMYNATTYMMFALCDYNQSPILLDGSTGYTHVINTTPRSYHNATFSLPIAGEGRHDVLIVFVQDPFNQSIDNESRMETAFSINPARYNVIVGNDTKPSIAYAEAPATDASYNVSALMVNKEPHSNNWWFTENASGGETLNFYINEWNGGVNTTDRAFAIVQLLDYGQTPIGNQTTYYGTVKAGMIATIPSSVVVPDDDRMHEILALSIGYPYEYDGSPQQLNYLQYSPRIGLL